jgi:hypothetical protein
MPRRALSAVILASASAACGPILDEHVSSDPPVPVDRWKELLVLDERVTASAAASNDADGPLGFRHAMERISASSGDPEAATRAWLDAWAPPTLPRLDLAHAPFRLIGVSSRLDLSPPEGRLLFAATDGAGDDSESSPLPITVIAEFRLDGDAAEWAARWHALGAHADFDAEYIQALVGVTEGFVAAEHLAQVRVNDASSGRATLYEMHPDAASGRLVPAKLRRTPSPSLDGSPDLAAFVLAHRDDVFADRHELPSEMEADRIDLGGTWGLPDVDEPLRHAFAASTCDGCHGTEHPVQDGAFHVSPLRVGRDRASRFLNDPDHSNDDELARREGVLRAFLATR